MNPLQKKCLIGSIAAHAGVWIAFLLGTAFSNSKPDQPSAAAAVEMVSDAVIAGVLNESNQQPAEEAAKPPPETPRPAVRRREPKPNPAPSPQETAREPYAPDPAPEPESAKPEPAPVKKRIVPNTRLVTSSQNAGPARPSDRSDRRRSVHETIENLTRKFANDTTIQTVGASSAALASYAQKVRRIYDRAWQLSGEIEDSDGVARVQIVVGRSGKVLSETLLERSGISKLDRSVQNALNAVNFIGPFPEGSNDATRTFIINFNLQAKRAAS